MRRNLAALLIGLLLASPIMTGCKSATEPGFDDEYQAWVGTWVGTNARFQINLQIRRGSPYLSCGGLIYSICSEYSDLYVTSSFSDAVTARLCSARQTGGRTSTVYPARGESHRTSASPASRS